MVDLNFSPLFTANASLRAGKYHEAISLYGELLLKYPALSKTISFNLNLARKKLWAIGAVDLLETEDQSIIKQFECKPATSTQMVNSFIDAVTCASEQSQLISFDVWDTVLRRICDPDEIKLRAARALWLLGPRSADSLNEINPLKLFLLRKDAERNIADEHYEYRFASVMFEWLKLYGVDDLGLVHDLSERIRWSEILAECSATYPDATVVKLLMSIRNKRRLAISDFYHSSENLASILEHHDLLKHFDCIYVSCDWMKTKRAGSLYDLVLQEEKIDPEKITHVGDNPQADYEQAYKKGIASYLYENPLEKSRIETLKTTFESYLSGNSKPHYKNILELLDYSSHVSASGNILNATGLPATGKLLTPIVVGFVLFCMQEAIRRKCPRIFFFAREGIFFKDVYDELVRLNVFDLDQYPQSEVLLVSRRATFGASMQQLSLEELMRMWSMYSTQSVVALARSLNLDVSRVAAIASSFGIEPNTPVQYPWQDERFKVFFHSVEFQAYAVPVLANQKKNLLRYLEHAGFEPSAAIDRVIVDIGWRGTIQDNISLLSQGKVHGIYLALKAYINQQPNNSTKSAYLSDENRAEFFDLGDVAALEFILNAAGGSCIGYDNDGTPQREIFDGEEKVISDQVAAIQSGLLEGTKALGHYIRMHGLIAEDIKPIACHLVSLYVNRPPTCIADAFLALEHNETFGTGDTDQIHQAYDLVKTAELKGAELHTALQQFRNKQRWPNSLFQTSHFKDLFASFRPDQNISIPCTEVGPSVFSIVRPETRRNIISLITPGPLAGSGGHRTIYNFAKGLARAGFNVHLMLENVNDDLWYVEQEIAGHDVTLHKQWFSGIYPQVAIATIAHSAKYVREFFPDAIGAYFVQDYEAEFNPLSDGYVRGQNSYAQGLAPICIGHWLPHVLRSQFGIGAAYGGLGVDSRIYHPIPGVEKKDMVALLYQPEKWRRMPETCIAALAIVKQHRPQTEIVLYGSNVQPNLPFDATQLGLIQDLSELNRVYNEASVGLCLSLTNPSRIPIEYMASGCVPVDLYRYNNMFDNLTGTALLAYQSEASIAEAILQLLNDKADYKMRRDKGLSLAKQRTLDWEVDTAVNAVKWLLSKGSFEKLQTPARTYYQSPIIAEIENTREVANFCKWQESLSV